MRVFLAAIWFLLMLPGTASCQVLASEELPQSYLLKVSALTNSIAQKHKSEIRLLRLFFHRSHRSYLKNYKAYATASDVFEKGSYDCLSGTYFLSLGLSNLGIKHRIIETNYHVFLIAETKLGDVLLESTDRFGGFISDPKRIEERISGYRNNFTSNASQLYLSRIKIYHEILPDQLMGLFYFNQAVVSFHKNNFAESSRHLECAWKIYDNPRIYEFAPILIHSILKSQLDERQKNNLTKVLKQHLSQSQQMLAIR